MVKKHKNILFVINNQNEILQISKLLEKTSHNWIVKYANCKNSFLNEVKTTPFDLVVTELSLKDFSEDEIFDQLLKHQQGAVRFIYSNNYDITKSLNSAKNAHQFITHPSSAEDIYEAVKRSLTLKNLILNERISKAVASIKELPTMPDIYIRLEKMLQNKEVTPAQIGDLISEDVAMTASILKFVNSSFFGLYTNIASPEKAVNLLGIDTIKGLVLGVHLFSKQKNMDFNYLIQQLQDHCRNTGLITRAIAKNEHLSANQICDFFLTGFLHDIGKLALASSFPDEYKAVTNIVIEEKIPVINVEKDILGFTHSEVGAYLLALWGFSPSIVQGVFYHHDITKLKKNTFCPAIAVHVADRFEHSSTNTDQYYISKYTCTKWLADNGYTEKLKIWSDMINKLLEH